MTTVEQKIKSVIEQMDGINYLFADWQRANMKLDNFPMPAVINLLPVSGSFKLDMLQLKDKPNCMLAFADLTNFNPDCTENDGIIDACKRRAMEFILRLNDSGLFSPVSGDIPYSVFYDKLDANITGITIELNLEESRGVVLCPGKSYNELFK